MAKAPTRKQKLVMVLVSTLLALVLCEIGLRLFWTGYYFDGPTWTIKHPTIGWENRPGWADEHGEPEFRTRFTIDSHGFRGPEVPAEKTAGKRRVLVLGDSFAWGIGCNDDETFTARLARRAPALETINAGVQGYGTFQELQALREKGLPLKPDVVVVEFFWNDLADNLVPPPAPPVPASAPGTPRELPPPPTVKWYQRIIRRTYLDRFVSDRWKTLRFRIELWAGKKAHKTGFLEPAELERAWGLVRERLGAIARESAAAGAKTVVIAIPDQTQVHPEWQVIGLADYVPHVQERLRAIGAEIGVPVVDLLPALREAAAAPGAPRLYYRQDRHLTPAGHEVVARVLEEQLAQLEPLAPPPRR